MIPYIFLKNYIDVVIISINFSKFVSLAVLLQSSDDEERLFTVHMKWKFEIAIENELPLSNCNTKFSFLL